MLKTIISYMYNWLLPFTCVLCQAPANCQQDLCHDCSLRLPTLSKICSYCAIKLAPSSLHAICGPCTLEKPPFDRMHALFAYQPPLPSLLAQLKYHQHLVYARLLGELMRNAIQHTWYKTHPLPDILIPMPLHPKRLIHRGYNQAIELARPIAQALPILLKTRLCERVKPTQPQTTIPAKARQQNVKNAFRATGSLAGLSIAVLDDVITTGHTVHSLCHTLKHAGAERIDVWCCARTQPL